MVVPGELSEQDICNKIITPALQRAGWDLQTQIYAEYELKPGRIVARGSLASRMRGRRADYVLFTTQGIPLAVVEAKRAKHSVGQGMQQALDYAESLGALFAFSCNGEAFLMHDRRPGADPVERRIEIDAFPSPSSLRGDWAANTGLDEEGLRLAEQPYAPLDPRKRPRYYQIRAINAVVEATARGDKRMLLVMATGTGKTFTAFQIIWRLWKSGRAKRILFLADRNILVDQTRINDFKPFGQAMTKITKGKVDTSYEIYLSLYQAVTGNDGAPDLYRQFSPDFFDLIVIDECHRGSAAEDAAWREILEYFTSAVQVGLTATPKETKEVSNIDYFGEPVYTYSLKQGIDDGFLAPYKVVRIDLDVDLDGWRPARGQKDKAGNLIEDRLYNRTDFDRVLVLDDRTEAVAAKITEYLKGTDRFAKTIVFCQNIDHAERMRQALVNLNGDLAAADRRYVMRITGDSDEGKRELDNFIDPEQVYPVIAVTSELMTTGVDAQTCKLIVLDQNIASMTKFKQIIGRGTRINEAYGKLFFTIMDFRGATRLFEDTDFDGPPEQIYEPGETGPPVPPDLGELDDPDHRDGEHSGEGEEDDAPVRKFVVGVGETVTVVAERVKFYDSDGRLVTESIKEYTQRRVREQYATLGDFLKHWTDAERKQVIIDELAEHGVIFELLRETVGSQYSAFDLVCHVAFEQPPLTRKQRADGVRAAGYFDTYSAAARQVLGALLDKYADEDLGAIDDAGILRVKPFPQIGSLKQIIGEFGGRERYDAAVRDLQAHLFEIRSTTKESA